MWGSCYESDCFPRFRQRILDAIEEVKAVGHWNEGRRHYFPGIYDTGVCGYYTMDPMAPAYMTSYQIEKNATFPTAIFGHAAQIGPFSCRGRLGFGCYRSKDIVLPPFSALDYHPPSFDDSKRNITLYFRGRMTTVERHTVLEIPNDEQFLISRETIDRMEAMQEIIRAKFCIVLLGLSPWSFRLSESVLAGCIPVICDTDATVLPFQESINWSEVSIPLIGCNITDLQEQVRSKTDKDIKQMQKKLAVASKYFEYGAWTAIGLYRQMIKQISLF
jgi:hypothetical protein